MGLNAHVSGHLVTGGKIRVLGVDDRTGCAGPHDLVDADRLDIALAGVHPAAHGRIQRDVVDGHPHFAVFGLAQRLGGQRPVLALG